MNLDDFRRSLPPHRGLAKRVKVKPVRVEAGHRQERRLTGISARGQRIRRVDARFPIEYGTVRGERKYRNVLHRAAGLLYVPGKPVRFRAAVTQKPLNRAERRWLERYFTAQDKEA